MSHKKIQKFIFLIAISFSAIIANIWAYWGIVENFHEGWYYEDLSTNVILMFRQYLSVPLTFSFIGLISIYWNKIGALIHAVLAVATFVYFKSTSAGLFLISIPLIFLAILYWFGTPNRKMFASIIVTGLPIMIMILLGFYHWNRVSSRFDDGNYNARIIKGNGIELTWAPKGIGWPDKGTSWDEAVWICSRLDSSGTKLLDTQVNLWRLPTVDEAVRSMVFHGKNAEGYWDSIHHKPIYKFRPDKESPLWNNYLKTIYWWTSTEFDSAEAYIVVYNGSVWPRNKKLKVAYLNFRAVK